MLLSEWRAKIARFFERDRHAAMKKAAKMRCAVMLSICAGCFLSAGPVNAEEKFGITITGDKTLLKSGETAIVQNGGRLEIGGGWFSVRFAEAGRKGSLFFQSRNQIQRVAEDKEDAKSVVVSCPTGDPDIDGQLTLAIRRGIPGVFLKAKLTNKGGKDVRIEYIFGQLAPEGGVRSYFISEDKRIEYPAPDGEKGLDRHDWIYARGTNAIGLGLVSSCKIFKAGRGGGSYLGWRTGPGNIKPGESLEMESVIFEAPDASAAEDVYIKIKDAKKEMLRVETGASRKTNKAVEIRKINAPAVDGQVMENEWKDAACIDDFCDNSDGKPVSRKTEAYMGYDDENLYFAFVCHEDMIDKITGSFKQRDEALWLDDCVEIFLDVSRQRKDCFHFILNCLGTQYDEKSGNKTWNARWLSKVWVGADRWTAEAAIPFNELGVNAVPDCQVWGFRLMREEKPHKENSVFPFGGVNNPARFAAMVFGGYEKQFAKRLDDLESEYQDCAGIINNLQDEEARAKGRENLEGINLSIQMLKEKVGSIKTDDRLWTRLNAKADQLHYQILTAFQAEKPYFVWRKNPMLAVSPDQLPPKGRAEMETLTISAFMNEREPASFVINNFTPEPKTFRVILRRLTGQGAPGFFIDPERMEIREGLFVGPQSQPVISDALPLLNESRAVSVAPGQAREIWLSINTQGIPPGVYEGDFYVVDTLGMAAFKKKLQVEVFPVCLPDKKPCEINYFPHWGSGHPSTIRRDRLETYVRDLSEHYCTMAWVQGWILPFPSFDSQGTVREMLDSRALPYFDDFMLLYKKYGIKPILYFGSKLVGFFAPECEETAAEWLKTFVAHMQGMGLGYDDFYFQLLDEPFPKHADILADAAAFVKKTDPNVKIFTTCGGATTLEVVKRVADNMDAWSPYGPYGNSLLYNEEAMKIMRKPGKKILFYNNKISNKHASPLEVVRKSAWAIRRYKTDGGGFWGYEGMYVPWKEKWFPNSGYNDFSDQYSWWVGDHGAVAYHDIRWRTGPVPSRRWEIWRDGIEDYTAIYLLEESIRKAKEKGVDTVPAKAILDEFDNKVMDDGNPDAIYDFRPRLAKALVDLNKHVDFGEMTPTARMEGKSVMIEWRANFPVQGTVYYQRENPFLSFSEDKPDAQKGRFDFDRQVFAAWVEVWQWKKTERASPTVQIKLDNLEPGVYTFCCSSADDFGTVRFDDNKGQNYRFAVNAVFGRGSRNGKDGRGASFKNQFERLSAGFLRFFRRLF